jgi:tetratricopeptide (TPR) repeat protein
MGNYQKAIEICDQVLRDKPNDAPAFYGISCCYALQEKREESIHYLELAIKQDPDYKKRASEDPEFEKIKSYSRFQELVS